MVVASMSLSASLYCFHEPISLPGGSSSAVSMRRGGCREFWKVHETRRFEQAVEILPLCSTSGSDPAL